MPNFQQTQFFRAPTTAPAAVNAALTRNRNFQVLSIRLHLTSAGVAGDVFTAKSGAASPYNVTFLSQDMTARSDLLVTYDPPLDVQGGEGVVFAMPNTGGGWASGLEVTFREEF